MTSGVLVGVLGPARKLSSAPMCAIVQALVQANKNFTIVQIDENFMLDTCVTCWPIVQVLVTLFAPPFPLDKVLHYVKLRNPVLVNNLYMQRYMMDRRDIRNVLQSAGVPMPNAVVVDRQNGDRVVQSKEGDVLCVYKSSGECDVIIKPFVEKPVDSEDHNVYIYYKGGGVRKLFRKTKRESSRFHDNLIAVRSTGNYIYEQFYEPEQCADVKVYAVGDYFYAEARKAPHIDGIVDRDQRGRERRIHVILSESELAICRKATAAFDQFVLGFDLLRGPADHRFVIDVNGWSLVKNSEEYAMQCGKLLAKHIELALQKHAQGIDIVQQKKRASLLHAALAQTSQQTTAELFDASQGNTCVV